MYNVYVNAQHFHNVKLKVTLQQQQRHQQKCILQNTKISFLLSSSIFLVYNCGREFRIHSFSFVLFLFFCFLFFLFFNLLLAIEKIENLNNVEMLQAITQNTYSFRINYFYC